MKRPDITKLKALSQRHLQRHRKKLIIGFSALAFVLFAAGLSGYLFLPGFIKSKAEQVVTQQLHRKLVIQDVSFNPFSLSVTLRGVSLSERESQEVFASFDRLYINLSSLSAFTFSAVIKEVELENPYIHFSRTKGNEYNISDFIEMAMKPDDPNKKPLSWSVNNIQIDGGKIIFDDHPMKAQHRVEELRVRLPSISSSPSRVGTFIEPHLSATVNGTKIALSGKTKPFAEDKETIFNLNLKNIDLPRYMEYLPYKPAFLLSKGALSLDLNLHFVQHKAKGSDLSISGTAQLDSLMVTDLSKKPMLGFEKLAVQLDKNAIFAGDYHIGKVELSRPDIQVVNSADGRLNLLALAPTKFAKETKEAAPTPAKEEKSQPLKLALKQFSVIDGKLGYADYAAGTPFNAKVGKFNLTVDDLAVDMGAKSARIGKIASDSAELEMALEKGRGRASPRKSRASTSGSGSAFDVGIGSINLGGWSAHLQNRSAKRLQGTKITDLTVNIQDVSTAPGKASELDIAANVDKKGRIAVKGKLAPLPLSADLAIDLKDVSLVAVQQVIDEHVNLTLRQADLSTKGHLLLSSGKNGALQGEYKGDVSLGNLDTTDQIRGDPFVRWKNFSLRQMHVKLSPFSMTVAQADLNSFFARLILDAEGRLNVKNILRSEAGGKKSLTDGDGAAAAADDKAKQVTEEEKKPEAQETQTAQTPSSLPPIRIDRFRLANGRVRFTDNFIKPHYTANLDRVHGAVTRISSASDAVAAIDLKGQVNRAPLTIAGGANLFNPTASLDIKGQVKGMELAQFSSYTTKFVGYGIEKGKLSFDVEYKVENGELKAENKLVLDQLTFGEKTNADPVIGLPVQFAVNLLKDGDGVIDINLPVSGSLNDPEFSVGGIVFKLIVNLIKKAVTAPFALLGAVFGGGEELSFLEFDPGKFDMTEKGVEKLTALVKALKGRPALKLDVTGCYDPEGDKSGLAKVAVERKARERKKKKMGAEGEKLRTSEIAITDEEYMNMLREVYSDGDFKKPRNLIGLQKSLSRQEMESLLGKNHRASEEDYRGLADKRAAAVKAWLLDKGGIPDERVFIQASKSRSGDNAARVDFSLH